MNTGEEPSGGFMKTLPAHDGPTLSQSLEGVLAEWSARTGVAVETWAMSGDGVPGPVAEAARAVLEMALADVAAHGGATTVAVAITWNRHGLRLTVSDDGPGTGDVADRQVAAMRARLVALRGGLSVNNVRGEGTTITGYVPR